ncbi:MAG: hypothetical protein HY698_20830 [Deltaproteobacteria bacterium]|nr:hypothetical protein [Deltaproteobacteria bacterium]
MRRFLVLALTLPILGGACTKALSVRSPREAAQGSRVDSWARFIPGETPYFFGNLEPLPPAFGDRLAGVLDPLLGMLEPELAKKRMAFEHRQELPEDDRVLKAILDEVRGNLSVKGLARIGLSFDLTYVVHGVGLFPVMRLGIRDPDALRGLVERIEAKSGVRAPRRKLGANEYWSFGDADRMAVVVAILEDELVIGFLASSTAPEVLPMILRQVTPKRSIIDEGKIAELVQRGYKYSYGIIDLVRIASIFLGNEGVLASKQLAAMEIDPSPLSKPCKNEILGLVSLMPRMVMGVERIDDRGSVTEGILELDPKVADALAALPAPVPGLALRPRGNPLATMGIGLDLGKTVDLLRQVATRIQENPYQCEHLDFLNEAAAGIGGAFLNPVMAQVAQFQGLYVMVEDVFPNGSAPEARVLSIIAHKSPSMFLSILGSAFPPLADIALNDDGVPIPLPLEEELPWVVEPTLAVRGQAIAFSIGNGMGTKLTEALGKSPGNPLPVFQFSYDGKRILDLMKRWDLLNKALDQGNLQLKAFLDAGQRWSGFYFSSMFFDRRGIVVKTGEELGTTETGIAR